MEIGLGYFDTRRFFLTLLDSYMVCWTVAVDGPVRTVFEACHKNRMIHTWYFNAHRSGW
jgi:hypothetical protein